MFDPFGITLGGESDGLRGYRFVPVAFCEGRDNIPSRRTHSGHRSGRTAEWNWSVGAGGHRARGGWKPSLTEKKDIYRKPRLHLIWKYIFYYYITLFQLLDCAFNVSYIIPQLQQHCCLCDLGSPKLSSEVQQAFQKYSDVVFHISCKLRLLMAICHI